MKTINIPSPSLLFIGDVTELAGVKTALGMRDWAPERCKGQWRLSPDAVDISLTDYTPEEAVKNGAQSMIIGAAPSGGVLPPHWLPAILQALNAGLDIVSGLHQDLAEIPEIQQASKKTGKKIINVRRYDGNLPVGTGLPRTGKRLLTVGTDVNLGKKYTALALTKELQNRDLKATFRATGQTGIMIAGSGLPLDSIVSDFVSGAAELLSPNNDADHWDIIEGQGSIVHPSFAAVTLGLLHGSQPDALVLCHDPTRLRIRGANHKEVPSLKHMMDLYIQNSQATNSEAKFVGISLNTSRLSAEDRHKFIEATEREFNLPVVDPIVTGVASIVEQLV